MIRAFYIWLVFVVSCSAQGTNFGKGWTGAVYPTPAIIRLPSTYTNTFRNWNDAHAGIGSRATMASKDLWIGDHYHALYERSRTASRPVPTTPSWFRSERSMLVAYKTWIRDNCGYFVNHSLGTGGNFSAYFSSTQATSVPMFTVTTLLTLSNVPTNYLAETPWRDLAGSIQSNVTDYTYGTNTTSEYGWKTMRQVISNLYMTQKRATLSGLGDPNYFRFVTGTTHNVRTCAASGPTNGPFGPVTCTNLTQNSPPTFPTQIGLLAQNSGTPSNFWSFSSSTMLVELGIDIYTNSETADALAPSIDLYFISLPQPAPFGGSIQYFSPWTQTATNTLYRQVTGATTSGARYVQRICNLEEPPTLDDPPPPHRAGYLVAGNIYEPSYVPQWVITWTYNY